MNEEIDNGPDTIKLSTGPVQTTNEREYAQYKYDQARATMLKSPTEENVNAFIEANKYLYEVEDSYRIGGRLLIQRVVSKMQQ